MDKGGLLTTNPVAVGDYVDFSMPENSETGVVERLHDRTNYLIRKAVLHAKKVHVLCANVDQVVLLFTVKSPKTSWGFANRFLAIAEAYHIPVVILLNKIDLLTNEQDLALKEDAMACYQKADYHVHAVSCTDLAYRELILSVFKGKTTFLGGHSGAGKSTLVNLLNPDVQIRTQEISDYNDKGMHTTTHSEMYDLGEDTYLIDAPGIKEMGLVDIDKHEIAHYFPEMRKKMHACKFNNCTHTNEPNCAVKAAVEAGEIHATRYNSYVRLFLSQAEEEEVY